MLLCGIRTPCTASSLAVDTSTSLALLTHACLSVFLLQEVVLKKSRLVIPLDDNICPMALRQLISSCWYDNPEERPSCAHIVSTLSRILKYCPPCC